MKYWAYFSGKIAVIAGIMSLLWSGLQVLKPKPQTMWGHEMDPFTTDLGYTLAVMVYGLICVAAVYLAILDQRYRCRACLTRLRMPVSRGRWNHIIFGAPRTEYICPFGHGTLDVPDSHLESPEEMNWRPIDDMWKELYELEETRK